MTEPKKSHHIMFIAGEASGDMHASHIINHLKTRHPDWQFSGIGGEEMRQAGMQIDFDLTRIAVVGFLEVLRHYPTFRQTFYDFIQLVQERKPAAIVFVDYPGFNLRMAKALHKTAVKKIYFISPQIWAWKAGRIKTIRKHIDEMMVIFRFEELYYQKLQYKVHFVGNPLMDNKQLLAQPRYERPADQAWNIALMPGSRRQEIKKILPVMLDVVRDLKTKKIPMNITLIKAATIHQADIDKHLQDSLTTVAIQEGRVTETIHQSDIVLVASGTATLEVGLSARPMVIMYKTSWITWLLAKFFLKIPYIGLVNIVMRKGIVPEFIQHQATARHITPFVERLMKEPKLYRKMVEDLIAVRTELDGGGATKKASAVIESVVLKSK